MAGVTVGQMQGMTLNGLGPDIVAFEFFATMQLRTPLRVLLWHGRLHGSRNQAPPVVAKEGWEGIWLPMYKPAEYSGHYIERMPRTGASEIGTVDIDAYCRYLLIIRKIAEAKGLSEKNKELLICSALRVPEWREFNERHNGIEMVAGRALWSR